MRLPSKRFNERLPANILKYALSLKGPAYLATANYGNIDYQAIHLAEGMVVNTREEVMNEVLRRMRLGEVRFLSMTGNVKDWALNPNMSVLVLCILARASVFADQSNPKTKRLSRGPGDTVCER